MGVLLYNANHEQIIPITSADSVTLGESNVKDKFGLVDGSLSEIGGKIDGVNTKISELEASIEASVGKIPEGLNNAFKSIVFKRQNSMPDTPTGGDYNNPIPEDWFDGIPEGEAVVWMTSRIFSSDEKYPQLAEWSEPKQMTDTDGFDVEFSLADIPGNPTDNPDNWSNESGESTIWMATRTGSNGDWADWQISKIKGEKGEAGTGVNIKGTLPTESDLPETPTTDSDSYLINGDLYVWDGDNWINVGNIKGEKGDTPYVHIKYANKATETTSSTFAAVVEGTSVLLTPTDGNGETPGNYIGILSNYVENDITEEITYSNYSWTKWKGEDGFGYEYIYTLSQEAPDVPTDETNPDGDTVLDDGFVPQGWYDNPCDPTENEGHCWICTRQKIGGVWSSFKGNPHDSGKASLYTKYTKDGVNGKDAVNLPVITGVESNIIIPCDSEGRLIEGTHTGAGKEEEISTYIYIKPKLIIGTEDVTENCSWAFVGDSAFNNETAAYNNSYLLIEEAGICSVIKINKESRQGKITITATYEEKNTVVEVTITKAFSGEKGDTGEKGDPATFTYYELSLSTNQIIAKIGTDGSLKSLEPSTLTIKATEFTQEGRKEAASVPNTYSFDVSCYDINGESIWTYGNYEYGQLLDITKNPETLETYTTIPKYFLVDMVESGSITRDFQRIPILYEYDAATIDLPEWVTNWDGEATVINDTKLLTGKLYAGAKPTNDDWTGVLIGNQVAKVKGLPGSTEEKQFSGILGLTNGTLSDTNEANVSFALDAETGDAYFKGEVHATSGTFTGEIKATSGTFLNGEITNSKVSDLFVSSQTDDYAVTIGTGNSNSTDGTADVFTINAVTTLVVNLSILLTENALSWDEEYDPTETIIGSGNKSNTVYLYPNTSTANELYNTIANAGADPWFIVEVTQADKYGNQVTVQYDAIVDTSSSTYEIRYTSQHISLSPLININCSNSGKTGKIQIVDLIPNLDMFSRTTMTGGSFKAEFSKSTSFSESDYVEIGPNGICSPNILTAKSGEAHSYPIGTLYVDDQGVVRASNGLGGYITA